MEEKRAAEPVTGQVGAGQATVFLNSQKGPDGGAVTTNGVQFSLFQVIVF